MDYGDAGDQQASQLSARREGQGRQQLLRSPRGVRGGVGGAEMEAIASAETKLFGSRWQPWGQIAKGQRLYFSYQSRAHGWDKGRREGQAACLWGTQPGPPGGEEMPTAGALGTGHTNPRPAPRATEGTFWETTDRESMKTSGGLFQGRMGSK